jgi:hypothetical protein
MPVGPVNVRNGESGMFTYLLCLLQGLFFKLLGIPFTINQ